jgi:hypothetical protein
VTNYHLWLDLYPKSQEARLHIIPNCIVVVALIKRICCYCYDTFDTSVIRF